MEGKMEYKRLKPDYTAYSAAKRQLEIKPLSPEQYDWEVKRIARKYGVQYEIQNNNKSHNQRT